VPAWAYAEPVAGCAHAGSQFSALTHEQAAGGGRRCLKFDAAFADKLRRRRPRPDDMGHLDEVFIRIGGELHYLRRAADQEGIVLDILVQSRRNAGAAMCRAFSSPTSWAATA